MPSREIKDLCQDLQPLCIEFLRKCRAEGIEAFLTCTYRSALEQDSLYAQGRSKPGKIVTRARGGQSNHNNVDAWGKPASQAFDIAIRGPNGLNWDTTSRAWRRAVEIGEELGLEAGAKWQSFQDWPHFQLGKVPNATEIT